MVVIRDEDSLSILCPCPSLSFIFFIELATATIETKTSLKDVKNLAAITISCRYLSLQTQQRLLIGPCSANQGHSGQACGPACRVLSSASPAPLAS